MDRNEKILKLKLDIIFKRIFGDVKNEDIIKTFLEDLLELPQKSIQNIYMDNVELLPDFLDQKFSRLDLKMKINDSIVNIEMQVNYENDYNDRTLFYWSKIFSEELKSGEEYSSLKQTICINIINFNQFDCDEYHSHFQLMEKDRHNVLTDKIAIHFFELKKIGRSRRKKRMEDWLDLINAETEGDLMDIQQGTVIPEVKRTIAVLRELSADEQLRRQAEMREKRIHDEVSALGSARREGEKTGMAKGMAKGIAKGLEMGITKGLEMGRDEGRNQTIEQLKAGLIAQGNSEEQIENILSIFEK